MPLHNNAPKNCVVFSRVLPSRPRGSTLAPSPLLINKNKYWYPKKKKRISSKQRRDNIYYPQFSSNVLYYAAQ